MSRQLPTPTLDQTNLSIRRPAPAPSLGLALARLVAPRAVGWYWPRRQLIETELRKLQRRQRERLPAPQAAPRKLRFHDFEPPASAHAPAA